LQESDQLYVSHNNAQKLQQTKIPSTQGMHRTSSSSDLDVQSIDPQFFASCSNVLSSQHSGVWGGLVTVGLDFHTTSDTGDGFAATGITQDVSL
jgi:hypothetical protein